MAILSFEFKARCSDPAALEARLQPLRPRIVGEDEQRDTYFRCTNGRLKLREGRIENALIHYKRPDEKGTKASEVLLYRHEPGSALKQILTAAFGIRVTVEKKRRILFVENVKFHFDDVPGLGQFVEVEALDENGDAGLDKLKEQCLFYADLFGIAPADYVAESYSDLLEGKT